MKNQKFSSIYTCSNKYTATLWIEEAILKNVLLRDRLQIIAYLAFSLVYQYIVSSVIG